MKEIGTKKVFTTPALPDYILDRLKEYDMQVSFSPTPKGTVLMAYTFASRTNEAGVVLQIPGTPLLDAVNVIAQAFVDSVPLLLVSTVRSYRDNGRGRIGELRTIDDVMGILSPITKSRERVTSIEEITVGVEKTYKEVMSNRPRPGYVEVAEDLFKLKAYPLAGSEQRPEKKTPDKNTVLKAAELLGNSKKPLIVAGYGVLTSGAAQLLQELAELLDAPVVTTIKGKGSIPASHPLFAGEGLGLMGTRASSQLSTEADVILALGTSFPQLSTGGWSFQYKGLLIHNNVDGEDVGKSYLPQLPAVADTGLFLKELLNALRQKFKEKVNRGSADLLRKLRDEENIPQHEGLWPVDVFNVLRESGYSKIFLDITAPTIDAIRLPIEKPYTWVTSETLLERGVAVAGALEDGSEGTVGITDLTGVLRYMDMILASNGAMSTILVLDDENTSYLELTKSDLPSIGRTQVETKVDLKTKLGAIEVRDEKELRETFGNTSKGVKVVQVKLSHDYKSIVL
ncbi:acetolactate synthase [Sulfodiicoccus acidiphilus]|uniref:2-oxoacid oxidoreductase (ferredoxin) n=1 Tax=Sulfodiicoccus acidiphilus TaxID=1670455 RepID=A0A348B2S0_9CREN|nr:acetolactate synthase [Sulfodiicoccus acidiphilus]